MFMTTASKDNRGTHEEVLNDSTTYDQMLTVVNSIDLYAVNESLTHMARLMLSQIINDALIKASHLLVHTVIDMPENTRISFHLTSQNSCSVNSLDVNSPDGSKVSQGKTKDQRINKLGLSLLRN